MSQVAGVIAPPPLLFLGFFALGYYGLSSTATGLTPLTREALGFIMTGSALALLVGARARFARAGTEVRPWKPTTALVIHGPYRLTRNPMYVAMTLLYLALSLWVNRLGPLMVLPGLLLTVHHGVILREERYLLRLFGDSYADYLQKVRRWL
jgi:protein-S-isoprenylcysteine O-methyltransferase Ste14